MVAKSTTLVDFFTDSPGLQQLMLWEYPGIIKDDQYLVDTSELGHATYCFYDLSQDILVDFLAKVEGSYNYEIRRSKDGMPLVAYGPLSR